MTNNFWSYAQNDGESNPEEQLPYDEYAQQAANSFLTMGWVLWTMQTLVEIWGAVFGGLYLLMLFTSSDWLLIVLPLLTYLLVGVFFTRQNEHNPAFIIPNQGVGYRMLYILAWPVRQALRDMQQIILTTWEAAPGKEPDRESIQLDLVFTTVKWLINWGFVCFAPTFLAILLGYVLD